MWNKISCVTAKSPFISCQLGTVIRLFPAQVRNSKAWAYILHPIVSNGNASVWEKYYRVRRKAFNQSWSYEHRYYNEEVSDIPFTSNFLDVKLLNLKTFNSEWTRNNVDQITWCTNFRMLEEYFLYDIKPSTIFRIVKLLQLVTPLTGFVTFQLLVAHLWWF